MEGGGILLIGKEDLLQMRGLMPESYGGIHFPSTFAAETLLYCTRFGYYVCNEDYCIVRERRNGYGLYYVAEGTMELKTLGQRLIAKEGNLIFFDRKYPYVFNSVDTLAYYGLHVNGAMFRAYYDLMIDKKGMLLSDNYPRDIKKHFENIIDMLSSINVNEHQVSVELHVVLALLASNAEERKELERDHPISRAIQFMKENYSRNISIQDVADDVHLSKYYLIRLFSEKVHCTPHKFLLRHRLRQADVLLQATSLSSEQIAEKCGFNSASHFARAFAMQYNMSPREFRDKNRYVQHPNEQQ